MTSSHNSIKMALVWCLAWGNERKPQFDLAVMQQMVEALKNGQEVPKDTQAIVKQVEELQNIPEDWFPNTLQELKNKYPLLCEQKTRIGLVYGGATKIKQYVFEASKLPDIRGGSALLDRINLIDLPAFFGKDYKPEKLHYKQYCESVRKDLDNYPLSVSDSFPLSNVLIPELIIYSTGGNILAFCPAAFVHDLANAIERRYTEQTLTANSCAVGDTFKLLELCFGLLQEPVENTPWVDFYAKALQEKDEVKRKLILAYLGKVETNAKAKANQSQNSEAKSLEQAVGERKSFNELATKLAILFNQRRSGNNFSNRPSRRYPPMFETHPYLVRDGSDNRSAILQASQLPKQPYFSETSARKHLVGDRAKKGDSQDLVPDWYKNNQLEWCSGIIEGWVDKFEDFLERNPEQKQKYYGNYDPNQVEFAQSLTQISKASKGFVAYIYADGNNVGGYIQTIRTAEKYKDFSEDITKATEFSVYKALANYLQPHKLTSLDEDSSYQEGTLIHPFEIITIGGDDIMLIVPANHALEIAKMIGEEFEKILLKQVPLSEVAQTEDKIKGNYQIDSPQQPVDITNFHRYSPQKAEISRCQLSLSIGVLLTAYNTPIYYAKDLTEQLLKSAKNRAKKLKKAGYYGGTVDFLTMKSVTMISSEIKEFRQEGLTKQINAQKLRLYAAPYTFHELGGLIQAAKVLKKSGFPKSQLYQIRSLLERGKKTAILNYLYFRTRLKNSDQRKLLQEDFEEAWCDAKTNNGNIAPWMYDPGNLDAEDVGYETIWRELVDIYDFIELPKIESTHQESKAMEVKK